MNNQLNSNVNDWEIAYIAKELRQKKRATLSCSDAERSTVLEKLSLFSNSSPILKNTFSMPHSNEVFMEIVEIF